MRKPLVLMLLCAALAAAAAWYAAPAGAVTSPLLSIYREETLVTTYYPTSKQETDELKYWVKGGRMRVDVAGRGDVTIVRPELNVVYMINTSRKIYSEASLDLYQRAGRATIAMLGADPTFQWTGRKKKIGAWQCREAVMAQDTGAAGERMKVIWWVTKDNLLNQQLLRQVMSITFGSPSDELANRFFQKLASLDGYPVQTETEIVSGNQGMRKVQTLNKLERRDIADSTFELPPGLTKVVVPVPPGYGG